MTQSSKNPKSSYQVGYKKPPIATRFKPGNRAYLKRSKASKAPEGSLFRKIMNVAVKLPRKSSTVYSSRMQIVVENFVAAAVRGDIGAADMLLQMHARSRELGDLNPVILIFDAADRDL